MSKTYLKRISVVHTDLNSTSDGVVQQALDILFDLIRENITDDEILDEDLFSDVLKIAKDHPNLRQDIVMRLQKLGMESFEIKRLIEQINELPPIKAPLIHRVTRVVFSLSTIMGGISVWLSWREGLLGAIFLLSSTLIVYSLYLQANRGKGIK